VSHRDLIFVAEDNAADANLLRIALRESQVECDLAIFSDGASALAAVAQAEAVAGTLPALFVLDLNLPNVSGMTILARIRGSSAFQQTPVIVWTSSDSPADQIESERSGADRYVCKPNDLETFLRLGEMAKGLIAARRTA
jgi:DNA-binding response OmpR family regulator